MKRDERAFLEGERERGDRETRAGPQVHGHSAEFGPGDLSGLYRHTKPLPPVIIFSPSVFSVPSHVGGTQW